jgi:hypothetical protein
MVMWNYFFRTRTWHAGNMQLSGLHVSSWHYGTFVQWYPQFVLLTVIEVLLETKENGTTLEPCGIATFAFGTFLYALLMQLYNPAPAGRCAIGGNVDESCLRGRSKRVANITIWLVVLFPLWSVIFVTTATMAVVYYTVKNQETKMETRYPFHSMALQ